MSLDQEIAVARKDIVADGYDMSLGEIMNLYKDEECWRRLSFDSECHSNFDRGLEANS